jgi:hypothetical protein
MWWHSILLTFHEMTSPRIWFWMGSSFLFRTYMKRCIISDHLLRIINESFESNLLELKYLELLKKFNIFGSQHKGWLPPDYGRKNYQDMTDEEQTVINEFDGSALEYQQVMQDKEYYLVEQGVNLVLLNPGSAA